MAPVDFRAITFERILDFCQDHLYAILFHSTFIFLLSLWAFRPTTTQASATTTGSSDSPGTASKKSLPQPAYNSKSTMAGFAPKTEVNLAPPKEDIISKEELSQCTGEIEGKPIYVAIKDNKVLEAEGRGCTGTIFDVSNKKDMYGPGAGYHVFAGKDASRALGKSSLKPEDAVADYSTLTQEELGVLNDWFTYFSKRYNIVGKVADS